MKKQNLGSDAEFINAQGKPTPKALLYGDMNLNQKFDKQDFKQIIKMWGKYTIDNQCLVPPVGADS